MKIIKIVILTFLLIIGSNLRSQELRIILDENKIIESTFSGDINQEATIHLIIYKQKKTKTYGITPLFYDKNKKVIQLDDIFFKKKPELISYHQSKGNRLTLLFKIENKDNKLPSLLNLENKKNTLVIVDYDLDTKKNSILTYDKFKKPDLIIKLPNKSIFIDYKKGKNTNLGLKIIENKNTISETNIKITPELKPYFFAIFNSGIDAINTNEYVKHGSFKTSKVFFTDNILNFVHVEKKTGKTTLLDINLGDTEKLNLDNLSIGIDTKIKDINSYLYDDKIFYIINTKKNVFVKIIDVSTKESLFNTDLVNNLSNHFNEKEIKKYISKTAKSFYSPTITVNTSIENNMIVNIGYVDNRVYNYYNDWWFHHWMWQQHIMQPIPTPNLPNFGPNPMKYEYYYIPSKDDEPFQIVLNSNFKIVANASKKTIRKNIDKDKYKKRLDNNLSIKYTSLAFTGNSARSIYYVKDRNEFVISHADYKH